MTRAARRRAAAPSGTHTHSTTRPTRETAVFGNLVRRVARLFTASPRRPDPTILALMPLEDRVTPAGGFTVTASTSSIPEGAGDIIFSVCLTGSEFNDQLHGTVDYKIGGDALNGDNYTLSMEQTGTLTFDSPSVIPIVVHTKDNHHPDGDLPVICTLSNATGTGISIGRASATIINIDPEPAPVDISVDAPTTVVQGQSGAFTIHRTGDLSQPVSVNYFVSGPARAGDDFTMDLSAGTVTFPDGADSVTIPFQATEKAFCGPNTSMKMHISGASAGKVTHPYAIVTLVNDNPKPTFDVVGMPDHLAPGQRVNVTVTLSRPTAQQAKVFVSLTGDGAPSDVVLMNTIEGSAYFPPFATMATFNIFAKPENDSYGLVNWHLNFRAGKALVGGNATYDFTAGIIESPVVQISEDRVVMVRSTDQTVTFTVSAAKKVKTPLSVHFKTTGGSAIAGEDFVDAAGAVTIPAGQKSTVITVIIKGRTQKGLGYRGFDLDLVASPDYTIGFGAGVRISLDHVDHVR
jgi:hypothetical protein